MFVTNTYPSSDDRHHKTFLDDTLLPLRDKTINARFWTRRHHPGNQVDRVRRHSEARPILSANTPGRTSNNSSYFLVSLPGVRPKRKPTSHCQVSDVPSHVDTMKFADKIDPFDPASERVETQLKFRCLVHTIALRSPATADVR